MKKFITPDQLRQDSFKLGEQIIKDGFKPDYMIALFRGGSTPACYIHEMLKYVYKIHIDHIAIRTSRYTGIDETLPEVQVHNLGYLVERLRKNDKVIIVDDVADSCLTIKAVLKALHDKLKDNTPTDIRIATIDYKPLRNQTDIVPHYYVNETNDWLVYPHELEGLNQDEIRQHWGDDIANRIDNCMKL